MKKFRSWRVGPTITRIQAKTTAIPKIKVSGSAISVSHFLRHRIHSRLKNLATRSGYPISGLPEPGFIFTSFYGIKANLLNDP